MLTSFLMMAVRHGLTSAGAVLVSKGLMGASDVEAAVGAVTALVGLGMSAWDKWKRAK